MNVHHIALCTLWLVLSAFGFSYLWSFTSAEGDQGAPSVAWPSDSLIPRQSGLPMLVMLAHPRCPCTLASIRELDRLMAQCGERLRASVLFYKPDGAPEEWAMTESWEHAAAIPGVSVLSDENGEEAGRFGAVTSGQVAVYSGTGALLFRGGITAGRGHSGDNYGRSAIADLVRGVEGTRATTPVFGCSITGYARHPESAPGEDQR
ncbi:MAG: hypothetical protein ACJAZN_000338 [Planctomycetota bacterium]